MRSRLPLILAVIALVVALTGTGRFDAVAQTVVDFARNADKVDGIHASTRPRAGRLVPLRSNKKFPRSVIPAQRIFTAQKAGPLAVASSLRPLVAVDLKAGKYLLIAKAWFRNDSAVAAALQCRLRAGTAFDEDALRLEASSTENARTLALPFLLVHQLTDAGRASVRCADFGADVKAHQIRLSALRLD